MVLHDDAPAPLLEVFLGQVRGDEAARLFGPGRALDEDRGPVEHEDLVILPAEPHVAEAVACLISMDWPPSISAAQMTGTASPERLGDRSAWRAVPDERAG